MEKTTPPTIEFVNLPNGKRAEMLVPNTTNKQLLCILPKPILEWLIQWTPKALMTDVIESFSSRAAECDTIQKWVELLQEELDFHASINMLQQYFRSEAKEKANYAMSRIV